MPRKKSEAAERAQRERVSRTLDQIDFSAWDKVWTKNPLHAEFEPYIRLAAWVVYRGVLDMAHMLSNRRPPAFNHLEEYTEEVREELRTWFHAPEGAKRSMAWYCQFLNLSPAMIRKYVGENHEEICNRKLPQEPPYEGLPEQVRRKPVSSVLDGYNGDGTEDLSNRWRHERQQTQAAV